MRLTGLMAPAPHLLQPTLRYASEADPHGFHAAIARGFHADYHPDRGQAWRAVTEWDRCFGFAADGQWISTCGAFSRRLSVPGGRQVPVAAVTVVTVAPAYRRRGLLRQMMQHQLESIAERGREPLALLWASESVIYGRFGYGSATPSLSLAGPTLTSGFRPDVDLGGGSVGEVPVEAFRAAAERVHADLLPARSGALDRPGGWWDVTVQDPEQDREGASAYRYCLHYDPAGAVDGYAYFRIKEEWGPTGPASEVRIRELDAASPQGYAALWRYLLDLDLVRRFRLEHAAADEPLRHLVADQRLVESRLTDATYARLVDVPRALEQRAYGAEVDVVIEVADPLLPDNQGRFRLQAGPEGATVHRVERSPDLTLGVRELGAIYVGGTPLTALARAGLVGEHRPGAVARAGNAFGWHRPPFCPDHF